MATPRMRQRPLLGDYGNNGKSFMLRKKGRLPELGNQDFVYVRDEVYSWLPAVIKSKGHLCATVMISLPADWKKKTVEYHSGLNNEERDIDLRDYPGNELPAQNLHDGVDDAEGLPDMTDLYFLHDAAILYNLRDRHFHGFPYTRVGDIMIAVNPFQWIDGLYSVKNQTFYANKLIWEEANKNKEEIEHEVHIGESTNLVDYKPLSYPPHIYETASLAYKGLVIDRENQTILVSGESGAGKTETVKLVMSYLATLESTHPKHEYDGTSENGDTYKSAMNTMVNKILQSNPIFEAFGNAKTIRNSNSSRFGKFTKLRFKLCEKAQDVGEAGEVPNCSLVGSTFQTYLLEKSRVINLDTGERLYHIFYQLIGAPEKDKIQIWDGLKSSTTSTFRYFGKSKIETIDGVPDQENWITTVNALKTIGITGDDFLSLMRSLCLILQFGNIVFAPDPSAPETSTVIVNHDELQKVSELIGLSEEVLITALTQRNVKASWEEINFSLSPADAKDGCDALAKEMYSLLFDFLVREVDSATHCNDCSADHPHADTGVISLLDIFGFECFKVNRFEQLCINYANERLQQKYVSDVFHEIQIEYEEEGIEVFDFRIIDNKNVLDLVEGKLGILKVLNEECVLPRGNDSSFVFKVKTVNKYSESLIKNNLFAPYEFAVAHFYGDVKYDARKFVERNKDSLPMDLINAALKSTNTIVASEFARREKRIAEDQGKIRINSRKGKGSTVVSKFKAQLTSLVNDIEFTKTRYIRCIKPNAEQLPHVTDNIMTMNQLSSAGITTAITIWRETYPKFLLYAQVYERFRCLAVIEMEESLDDKGKASKLLSVLFEGKYKVVGGQVITPYTCGKTKAFFRSGSLELLESSRSKLFSQSAVAVQKRIRGIIARKQYTSLQKAVLRLQSLWRGKIIRRDYLYILRCIVTMQTVVRMLFAAKIFNKLKMEKAATTIQKRWKGRSEQLSFNAIKRAAVVIQKTFRSKWNRAKLWQSLVKLALKAKREADLRKNQNSDIAVQYFSEQESLLRAEIAELKGELENERNKSKLLKLHNENVQAYSAANKFEISLLNDKITRLSKDSNFQRNENAKLRKMIKEIQQSHTKQIHHHHDALIRLHEQKNDEILKLEKERKEMKKKHEMEVKSLKNKMRKARSIHRSDVLALKGEIKQILHAHQADLARMFEVLEAAQASDLLIQSIDEYTKSSYEAKVKNLKSGIDL